MTNLKDDFPLLERTIDDIGITYLDSAATTLKPRQVVEKELEFVYQYTSNVHRGHSALADEATYEYESARRKLARFIKADPDCVVLTPNTSYALATVAHGLDFLSGNTILCAAHNHHSNLLPWMRRAKVVYIEGDPLAPLTIDSVVKAIETHRPALLAFSWVSNVNGVISPAKEICHIARAHNVLTMVDAAQAAAHLVIDVHDLGADFIAFSGHKMLGPTGTGVLWGRREILEHVHPLVIAGGSVDHVWADRFTLKKLPWRLEAGTPNISGVIGLGAAVDYIERIGHEKIADMEAKLVFALHDALKNIPNVYKLMAPTEVPQVAIASLVPKNNMLHSDVLCQMLSNSFAIMTRSGFHCAHPLFDSQGFKHGAVRISAYIYNSPSQIYQTRDALLKIL